MNAGTSPSDRGPSDRTGPLVFIAKVQGAFRLHALDEDALAAGLTPGMGLADARARFPDLLAVSHDPEGEAAFMARLADLCDRYTPMVAIDLPDGLVLDITGCTHLFGGEAPLARDALRLMRAMGLRSRCACAATPEAALALARCGEKARGNEQAAIHRLPLLALRLEPGALLALRRAGFTTVGDLAPLPPAPLAARFGAAMVDALDRLLCRIDSRITPRRLPPAIRVERRFAEPVAHIDTVMGVIGELLGEACVQLAERHEGGRRFAVRLWRSDGVTCDLAVETGQPVRVPEIVLRLVQERIDALSDPLDPGFGFDLIRLAVPVVEPLAAAQPGLDGGRAVSGELAALLDTLGARAGAARFSRFVAQESHIPERAMRLVPTAMKTVEAADWPEREAGEPPLRPLVLLQTPEPVEALAEVPDGPPRWFRWRGAMHRIVAQEGPERIAPEWWRRRDGHGANPGLSRDYYRLEDEAGQRFWVFRHGLYERETVQPRWYVHGLYA